MKIFQNELKAELITLITEGKWQGDSSIALDNVCEIAEANARSIVFCEQEKLIAKAKASPAGLIITTFSFAPHFGDRPLLIVDKPYFSLMKLIAYQLQQEERQKLPFIHPKAIIAESADIAEGVSIGAHSIIGENVHIGKGTRIGNGCSVADNCTIGASSLLYDNVTLYDSSLIGQRCILHSGVVIGADGFGFLLMEGIQQKIPQVGNVVIGDDVEIGANSTIDRATLGSTIIGKGTKIDNLVQIGHNCIIGEHSIICAQVGLAGSTTIGDYVYLAGQVGAAGHITIASKAMVGAQSGVSADIPEGARYFGTPALEASQSKRILVAQRYLPEMLKAYQKEKKGKDNG